MGRHLQWAQRRQRGCLHDVRGCHVATYVLALCTNSVFSRWAVVVTIIYIGFFSEWVYRWRKDRPVRRQYKPFPGKKAKAQAKAERAAMRHPEDQHHLAAVGSSAAVDKDLPAVGSAPSYVPTSYSSQPAPESRVRLMAIMIAFTTLLIVVR